jgi:hypothetical protein
MVYPVFSFESIQTRCNEDIEQFSKDNNLEDKTGLTLIIDATIFVNKQTLIDKIKPIMEYLNTKLEGKTYISYVSAGQDKLILNQLWIARTYLFYQLLIFATATFLNKALYEEVYTDINIDDKNKFPYREDIKENELRDFKLGIFGSKTPTSDIDIGIQYSGDTLEIPALAYIVSRFENLFLIFTGKASLDYDIETYADMMTIPNPDKTDIEHVDYFYLDASIFKEKHFNKMLSCAGNSIIRNVLLAYTDLHKVKSDFNNFDFNDIIMLLTENPISIQIPDDFQPIKDKLIKNQEWFNNAKVKVQKFLNMTYDVQRYEYYTKVNIAEQLKFKKVNKNNLNNLSADDICDIMVAIGEALTYRMESYTCAPTVIHVVRILQASKDAEGNNKYATLTPGVYCKDAAQIEHLHLEPFCAIGYYGYILSILEQIGYLYRFHLTYCGANAHYNETKCNNKFKKYNDRYTNGVKYFEELTKLNSLVQYDNKAGGKHTRTRTNHKITSKTSKSKSKSKSKSRKNKKAKSRVKNKKYHY